MLASEKRDPALNLVLEAEHRSGPPRFRAMFIRCRLAYSLFADSTSGITLVQYPAIIMATETNAAIDPMAPVTMAGN